VPKSVTINGVARNIPLPGEVGYDQGLDDTLNAMLTGLQQTGGGTVLAGWKQRVSAAVNVATSGWARFSNSARIAWRNLHGTGDLALGVDNLGSNFPSMPTDSLSTQAVDTQNQLYEAVNDDLGITPNRRLTVLPATRIHTASTNSSVGSSPTTLKFSNVVEDTDSVYNSSTGVWTISRPGLYMFYGQRAVQNFASGGNRVSTNVALTISLGGNQLYTGTLTFGTYQLNGNTSAENYQIVFPFFVPVGTVGTILMQELTSTGTATMVQLGDDSWMTSVLVPL